MPELPEVETTLRGLKPHLEGERIRTAVIRKRALRLPITLSVEQLTAHLWTTHQIDAFRTAAVDYVGKSSAASTPMRSVSAEA